MLIISTSWMRNLKQYHRLFKLIDFNVEYQDRKKCIFPNSLICKHVPLQKKKYLYASRESRLRKDEMVAKVLHG